MAFTIDDLRNGVNTANQNIDQATVNIDGAELPLAQSFKDAAKQYLGSGAAKMADALQRGEETVEKLEKVGEDVATGTAVGAGIGSVVPILGTAIGGVVGSWVGGVYGVFDNFGGDIEEALHNTLNPEDFTPGDYDRMRLRCVKSGGLPHPGHAPDNEDGCVYPSGGMSGGEYPRDPGPGRSVRGDNRYPAPWNGDFEPGMVPDINGYPVPAVRLKTPAPPPRTVTFPVPLQILRGNMTKTLNLAQAKLAANAQAIANMKNHVPAPMPKIAPPPPHLLFKVPNAQALVAAAQAAQASQAKTAAQAQIKDIVDGARAGDPKALEDARILTFAQRGLLEKQFVAHYLAIRNSKPLNTGALQVVGAAPRTKCQDGGDCCDDCGPKWSGAETARRLGRRAGGLTTNGFGGGEMR